MAGPERRRLTDAEFDGLENGLPGWTVRGGRDGGLLVRDLEFDDFVRAFGFMASVAIEAERLNHHPDWSNSYRRVHIELTTHDLGGLSTLDVELARRIDALAGPA